MAVGSVVKAIAILRYLAGSPPQGVNAIARALEISPSSCFSILKTLAAEGFVDFDQVTKAYSLGSAPAEIFAVDVRMEQWCLWLDDHMAELARTCKACVGLWQRRSDRVELRSVADSPLDTRLHLTVGQRLPAWIGAMGRCIVARESVPRQQYQEIVQGLRWEEPPTPEAYARDIRNATRNGWAVDDGHYLRGVQTIASAIADSGGSVKFCLTVSSFKGQFDSADIVRTGESLRDLARLAEAELPGD